MTTEPPAPEEPPKRSLREAVALYLRPRALVMLIFGFSAGLPFYLIFQTLSIWLREEGVSRGEIGLFAWAGFAFTFKFLWAPVLDRVPVPILERMIGRRRAWMALAQLSVAATLLAMSFADPGTNLVYVAVVAVAIAFASATQDIAVDAWRIEAGTDEEQGVLAAMYQYGYRVGILVASAGALIIADAVNWAFAYQAMAGLMMIGFATALFAPKVEARQHVAPPRLPPMQALKESVIGPFMDFLKRYGGAAVVILAFIALFRIPDFVMGYMTGPLYVDLGYDKTEIGVIRSGAGMIATMLGVFLGGVLLLRVSFMPALLIGVAAQSATNLLYSWLSLMPAKSLYLAIAVVVDNIAYGMAGTILIAYMSSLTNAAFTATQYALFSSFYALPGKFVGGFSGFMVDAMGYAWFFALTALMGVPAAGLIYFLSRSERRLRRAASDAPPQPA
ncbi:AmpG family muropeptide MFS transporter [Amphiplicatus metriothermophilus]|uniref:MFS transporter, PAT family, beta-lactamase induction signal transducer AmpG n=1 Tax=Amphiplicatus metriothermophilus TaxID=1519374 RepID=A0A239PKE8_9PROT|nr:MFS transporter [Amphiplicatus metriothermophilus]MBB5517636.1 PAT family beta-lactamase induction signal transducer AmpG [Amphiplicatus metriothermophilus]SNT68030.1 MFS transporter, PAT family, beta-lactamase induction signal transducer AmpG [Amphiplicatus metriothermophilus]